MNFNLRLPDERCFKNGYCIVDEARDRYEALSINELVDRLNGQEELIKRLKTIREEQTETILKQKRKIKELEERNKRQYNQLKKLEDLMLKRDWKTLENMVEEWEKADELLEQEWGTYCGDVDACKNK